MNLNRTSAIVIRHLYLVSGSPARVLPLFAWVAIDMVLWGFITKYLNAVSSAKFDFVPVFLGAVLLWDFFTRVMHGVTMALARELIAAHAPVPGPSRNRVHRVLQQQRR